MVMVTIETRKLLPFHRKNDRIGAGTPLPVESNYVVTKKVALRFTCGIGFTCCAVSSLRRSHKHASVGNAVVSHRFAFGLG